MAGWVPRRLRSGRMIRKERRAASKRLHEASAGSAPAAMRRGELQARLEGLEMEMNRLESILSGVDAEIAVRIEESISAQESLTLAVLRLEKEAVPLKKAAALKKAADLRRKASLPKRPMPIKPKQGFPRLPREPVVPIATSIKPDAIVCLIDGEPRKMLHRHLRTKYGITPEEYRRHFGLEDDYPMTAPGYSKSQSSAVTAAIEDGRYVPHLSKQKAAKGKRSRKESMQETVPTEDFNG